MHSLSSKFPAFLSCHCALSTHTHTHTQSLVSHPSCLILTIERLLSPWRWLMLGEKVGGETSSSPASSSHPQILILPATIVRDHRLAVAVLPQRVLLGAGLQTYPAHVHLFFPHMLLSHLRIRILDADCWIEGVGSVMFCRVEASTHCSSLSLSLTLGCGSALFDFRFSLSAGRL